MENREIEVRFLEIDKDALIKKLRGLGAEDLGEDLLQDIIFYDKELTWQQRFKKIVYLRQNKDGVALKYKFKEEGTSGAEVEEMKLHGQARGIPSLRSSLRACPRSEIPHRGPPFTHGQARGPLVRG